MLQQPSADQIPVSDAAPKGWKPVNISGTELREMFKRGGLPPAGILRPETARVLIER